MIWGSTPRVKGEGHSPLHRRQPQYIVGLVFDGRPQYLSKNVRQ